MSWKCSTNNTGIWFFDNMLRASTIHGKISRLFFIKASATCNTKATNNYQPFSVLKQEDKETGILPLNGHLKYQHLLGNYFNKALNIVL
jgi:hypothetical protein